ncbi:MAG TPA: hypothetical protein VF152_02230 [Acidimicrobiia bacterium]
MLRVEWLLAQSSSEGFSLPILAAAAAAGVVWLALAAAIALARRVPDVDAGPATQDLPPESPALASMLCDDFELGTEEVPATVVDLAARGVLELEEVQPGRTICRVRRPDPDGLTPYEQRVLESIAAKAIDGVVPAQALTTGPEAASRGWHRAYDKEVIAEAQARGLTYDRWPAGLVGLVGLGAFVVFGLIVLAGYVGGETTRDEIAPAVAAGGVAGVSVAALVGVSAAWQRSLAQLPTADGTRAAARCLGFQRHLHENEHFDHAPAASVVIWGRHLAYATALGAAAACVAALPMGAEDDRHAWSRHGGRWRKVRVRYPRGLPPGWGKHPAFALFLAVVWGGLAAAAVYGLVRVADAELTADPTFSREQLDWIGRSALIACIPFLVAIGWSLWVLARALPDLWQRREITGDVVRARRRRQIFASDGDDPKYWNYLAIDDGSSTRIRAFRVREDLYRAAPQGATVTVVVTPGLGHLREVRRERAPAG